MSFTLSAIGRLTCTLALVFALLDERVTRAVEVDFNGDVAPILVKRCLECHGAGEPSAKLNLTTASGLTTGGESGPAVVAGQSAESLLWETAQAGEMPPAKAGKSQKLPAAELAILKSWIDGGANWPQNRQLDLYEQTSDVRGGRDWWSFQPVNRPQVPVVEGVSHPVDAFVREALAKRSLEPRPRTAPRSLIRRVAYDLTGLPPTFEQIAEFEADHSPAAYERLVDRLLASPQFGERWGRYWLDLVRYADTCGYERDQEKPFAWKYRDWVIRSINADMPYDEFVRQQLAGDEIPTVTEDSVIATGFLRLGTWNDEPNDADEYKYERLEDMVHVTSSAFLGLTVKCARCHDHKFDPIPHVDYYRMANAFWPGAIEPRERELLGGPKPEELGFAVLGWTDIRRNPPPLHLLKKGDPKLPGPVVEPGQLSLVAGLDRSSRPADAKTTHRRLELANWIVDPKNPLTPRVLVNRLWMHHFGQGIVRSANNFGYKGDLPTHPELLDYLADELVAGGWKLKRLHKLLVMSETYQQGSIHPRESEYALKDGGNRLWWRAERRRLDAEAIRDSLLVASGRLDLTPGGPSFKPDVSPEALEGLSRKSAAWAPSPPEAQRRRSVYMFSQRSLLPPLMTTFDFCDTTEPCGQRDVSLVPPQALALLNNPFVHEQSLVLARRAQEIGKNNAAGQVRAAWQFALGRLPSKREQAAALNHLADQRKNFESRDESPTAATTTDGLVLHLRAETGISRDATGRVNGWKDQSPAGHDAVQADANQRPLLVENAIGERPAIRFEGSQRFLHVAGQVLTSQEFSIVAVVSDRGKPGHREIFSNWNGAAGNAGQSVFFGLTAENQVRLTDEFANAGAIRERQSPFVLSGVASSSDAAVYQNGRELARRAGSLSPRRLETAYVIGTQGNIGSEDWVGDIAELQVFNRVLSDVERRAIERGLSRQYGLPREDAIAVDLQALASLCHVLLNSNEFLYVD